MFRFKPTLIIFVSLMFNLQLIARAEPGELHLDEVIKRSHWVIVAKPIKDHFQTVDKTCPELSKWKFEVEQVLSADPKTEHPLKKGDKIEVFSAAYDAVLTDWHRRTKQEGGVAHKPEHYRPRDTTIHLDEDLPADTSLILFLVHRPGAPERPLFKERTEFVAVNSFEHVREKKMVQDESAKVKKD